MARKAYGLHATQVNLSSYPDDGTSPVGSAEWNEALDPQGMLGFTPQTSTVTIASGAVSGLESGYPKADDTGNSENTGAAVDAVTYKFAWTTAQINTSAGNAITGGAIYDVGQSSPVNATKLLTHWNFTSPASFHKTNTDTLTLYVNHTMNGT